MDKLDLILEKLIRLEEKTNKIEEKTNKIEEKTNKIDKIESDIAALKADSKVTHQKMDMIINEVANIKEQITDHDIKIQVLNNKAKAI